MKISKKNIFIIFALLICIAIIIIIVLNSINKKIEPNSVLNKIDVEDIVPTTDASTIASLTSLNSGKDVTLAMEGIPNGTEKIEYEVSYSTKQQGFQGVSGTVVLNDKEKNYEKKFTLGTCSSGKCVYHEVVGGIKTTLKFTGSYGEKILEKEFNL